MIVDSINLYTGIDAAETLQSLSAMIRPMIANSLSFEQKFYNQTFDFYMQFEYEEDLEMRCYDV
jgi:hypothetical protein